MKSIICILAVSLAGCDISIQILSATRTSVSAADLANIEVMSTDQSIQKWEKIRLTVNSIDVLRAMRVESTIFINVTDCEKKSPEFPSVAFFDTATLDERQKKVAEDLTENDRVITIDGYAPTSFTSKLKSTCVDLQGGSYMGYSVRSNFILVRAEAQP